MRRISVIALAVAVALSTCSTASAQWTSGSNGSDGALNITAAGTTVLDPVALGLDVDGDNVFHFTTINIAAGSTLKLRASKLRSREVIWLATGDVSIAGTVDLSGADGYSGGGDQSLRGPSEPGPGGYPGGVGVVTGSQARPGAGPGANANASWDYGNGCGAAHANAVICHSTQSNTYGSALLTPLIGGSGGGGGSNGSFAGGGGAGGGAIRIASSTAITLSGAIRANGGSGGSGGANSSCGGPASGGAVHLQAPSVSGAGAMSANAGGSCYFGASPGRIRIDGNTVSMSGAVTPGPRIGPLQTIPLPANVPTVKVTTVNGVAVPAVPGGSAQAVDVNIDTAGPVAIAVAASNIPLGTVLKLWISSEVGSDQLVDTSALAGTLANSTASVTVTLPAGVSKILAQAKW